MKKNQGRAVFDPERHIPVLRSSICTGEQTFGFKDKATGRIEEVACIHSPEELARLLREFGLQDEQIKRIW